MLEHYVFLKYREGTSATHVATFCERMLALLDSIDQIRRLEIGRDELHDARSWDLVLIMAFDSVDAAACLPGASGTRRAHELQRSLREGRGVRGFHQNRADTTHSRMTLTWKTEASRSAAVQAARGQRLAENLR
jgi:Stress responsive A/B Barrel Domain